MLEGTATWLQGFTHALEAEELPRSIDFSHETDHLDPLARACQTTMPEQYSRLAMGQAGVKRKMRIELKYLACG